MLVAMDDEGHQAACHFADELIGVKSKFSQPVPAGGAG